MDITEDSVAMDEGVQAGDSPAATTLVPPQSEKSKGCTEASRQSSNGMESSTSTAEAMPAKDLQIETDPDRQGTATPATGSRAPEL